MSASSIVKTASLLLLLSLLAGAYMRSFYSAGKESGWRRGFKKGFDAGERFGYKAGVVAGMLDGARREREFRDLEENISRAAPRHQEPKT